MNRIILFLLLLVSIHSLRAQSLSLFSIDAASFPVMKVKLYAFDASGKQQRPAINELTLTEDGTPRTITAVTCPPVLPPKALSSVLVFDLSVSMGYGSNPTNLDIAKAAANAWITSLPLGASECAVTSFNNYNYLNQDFTTDRTKLLNAVSALTPSGGTDYDKALVSPQAGGLLISSKGKHQRVIVLLTDGQGAGNESAIVAEARRQNCSIYCITVGMPAPPILKNIAAQTGGLYVENVNSVQDAESIYRRILDIAQNGTPCEVSWTSTAPCSPDTRIVEVTWRATTAQAGYIPPASAVTSLLVSPSFVSFGAQKPATAVNRTITLLARNADYVVTAIRRGVGSPDFSVVNTTFPLTIPKNTTKTITLRFLPTDSVMKYASFEIESNSCSAFLSARGGFKEFPLVQTLRLLKPNGGEVYTVGSDTMITWAGVAQTESVGLDYSIDTGRTWTPITQNASRLQYRWQNIPNTPSTQCKVRVRQRWASGGEPGQRQFSLAEHTSDVYSVAWSPDGSKLITVSDDNTAIIWDPSFGTKLVTLTGHGGPIRAAVWSPDGTKIVTAGDDRTAIVWNAVTGVKLLTLSGHTNTIWDVSWSPDGKSIATASKDMTAIAWNATTGSKLFTMGSHSKDVIMARWSPDGSKIATAGFDTKAFVWEVATGVQLTALVDHTGELTTISWSPDGSMIATAGRDATLVIWDTASALIKLKFFGQRDVIKSVNWSPDGTKIAAGGYDKQVIVYDITTGQQLLTLIGHSDYVHSVTWSPDGTKIASTGFDNTTIIWDAVTGERLYTLVGQTSWVYEAVWSPDGTRVATASKDHTAALWFVDNIPVQIDTSDAVFTIVVPKVSSQNIDVRQCLVGSSKDSSVASFITNPGPFPCRIDSIYFTGPDASSFGLVSGVPVYTLAPNTPTVTEFRFMPRRRGIHSATIRIVTQAETIQKTIVGEGVIPSVDVLGTVINFGKILVNTTKDSLRAATIKNSGQVPLTITSMRQAGPNTTDFSTGSGSTSFTLNPGDTAFVDIQFHPKEIGRSNGSLAFEFDGPGSPAIVQLFGEAINQSSLAAPADILFDTSCIQQTKTMNATISNDGSDTLQLLRAEWVTNTGNSFSIPFVFRELLPDSSSRIPLDFLPATMGVYSGEVRWVADKDTAYTTVSGIGVKCINTADTILSVVVAKDIVANAGEEVAVRVLLEKQAKMYLPDAPTTWKARLHYNRSILHQLSGLPCRGTDDSCSMEFTGIYNPSNDTLVSIPCILTLGATDHSSIIIDEFRWTDGWVTTNIQTQNGDVRLANICEDGGVRLFIPAKNSTSLSTRPNPAQDNLQIHYGLREPLTVTLELLTMTGQVVQTILNNQSQAGGQYTLTSDLSVLGNGVYMLRMRTNKEMLTTRVDVVK
ncbi:MAG: choice-of-anchor D domain-containing protein [Candidatus Kapaibacterium sp.]